MSFFPETNLSVLRFWLPKQSPFVVTWHNVLYIVEGIRVEIFFNWYHSHAIVETNPSSRAEPQ